MKSEKRSDRPVGRPRLHPDGLTERLCVPVTRAEYERLERLSKACDVSKAQIARKRIFG